MQGQQNRMVRELAKPVLLDLLADADVVAALREALGPVADPRLTRRQLRDRKSLTCHQASDRTGGLVSAANISHWETGRVEHVGGRNKKGLVALCNVLGCSVGEYISAPVTAKAGV
jgi:DNA-binding Xre family transcriptional regulator